MLVKRATASDGCSHTCPSKATPRNPIFRHSATFSAVIPPKAITGTRLFCKFSFRYFGAKADGYPCLEMLSNTGLRKA